MRLMGDQRGHTTAAVAVLGCHSAAAHRMCSLFLCVMNVPAFAELQSSSAQAQSDIDELAKKMRAALKRRQNQLTQQLQQQKEVS